MILIEKLHLFSCIFMVGVIWLVQIVQYPSFFLVPSNQFVNYHLKHSDRISYVVAPVMLTELVCAYWLFYELGEKFLYFLILSVLIFAATAFISVPLHNKLSKAKDEKVISQLVCTNWLRTAMWSVKLILLFLN